MNGPPFVYSAFITDRLRSHRIYTALHASMPGIEKRSRPSMSHPSP
jgi:hypothetical protein